MYDRETVLNLYRQWGFLKAKIDPLDISGKRIDVELPEEGEDAAFAKKVYCSYIGAEFMHSPNKELREYVAYFMEEKKITYDKKRVLDFLIKASIFEEVAHRRYVGTKRFSVEGLTSLIPLVAHILDKAILLNFEQTLIAMAHRGRLNLLLNIACKDPIEIFAGFEDVDPRSVLGGGDVKYHLGATGVFSSPRGKIRVHIASNPSHLESIDPVAMGRVRAKALRYGSLEEGVKKILPITLHGDAAFIGQGIVAETLNLMSLEGYTVGGTIRIIVNNLIGFTTLPSSYTSSIFPTDEALRLRVPIFHVNSRDIDSVLKVAELAFNLRNKFGIDCFIDLVGFRRYGHSEIDDPTLTQPTMYKKIASIPPMWRDVAERWGLVDFAYARAKEVEEEFLSALEKAKKIERRPRLATLPDYWNRYVGGRYRNDFDVPTSINEDSIKILKEYLTTPPNNFSLHPKLKRLLEQRKSMFEGKIPVDFGSAEQLAFGSLLLDGVPIRLSGEDSCRGTFNHRHAVWVDYENGNRFSPFSRIKGNRAFFEIYDSPLSEAGVLGFEYGYSRDFPEALVIWEAQFGDFANGAQIIIDQFIVSGEDKWGLLSGLVILLPHGYEGQGPEHSSARIERFLQLAAEDNIIVTQPSTASQYFHLLRRQALWKLRKPLIVFTPKSLLRAKRASSDIDSFLNGSFKRVLDDPKIKSKVKRLIFCTGKIAHELRAERDKEQKDNVAVVTVEELYPFPEKDIEEIVDFYSPKEIIWVQEEPANQGALFYIVPRLEKVTSSYIRTIKRSEGASPATGSMKAHLIEQKTLIDLALSEVV